MALITVKEQGVLQQSSTIAGESTVTRYFVALYDAPTNLWAAQGDISTTLTTENVNFILPGDESSDAPRRVKQIQGRTVNEESTRREWLFQVDYSNKVDSVGQSPLDLPDEITWDFSESSEPYFLDHSDTPKPVVNSAGQAFEQMLERETGHVTVTIKRNVSSYDPQQAVSYLHVVNSDAFTVDGVTIAPSQAKMSGIPATAWQTAPVGTTVVRYRTVTYTMKLKATWDDVVADYGFAEKDTAHAGKVKDIIKGTPPVKPDRPWPLDGSGAAKTNSTDTPANLTFKPYAKLAFSGFGFS